MSGKVYLVGAGPGDWRLLTLRGKELLETADVVITDHLASPRLLSFCKDSAECIYVGKQANHHTMPQEAINELLIEKAREGCTVVRLKGGDPFVFGRGGEEGTALRAAGIPFEIVPGISSALAVPAYAGIPVTDRSCASSFAVITGHERPDKDHSSIHWQQLATAVDTLVFLMGVKNLPTITENLIKYGRKPATPCALIRWGTLGIQDTLVTTLERAAEDAAAAKLRPPAVFIVGDVVCCREKLQWFETKPLWGLRIGVTRSRQQASRLSTMLEESGAYAIEVPTIRLVDPPDGYQDLDAAITHLSRYSWLVFSSHNGVERFFARLWLQKLDTRALGKIKVAAIGSATAHHLERYGLRADLVPTSFRSEALRDALLPRLTKTDRVLWIRSQKARPVLEQALEAKGIPYDGVVAYAPVPALENKERLCSLLQAGELDYITLTSASTVTSLLTLLGPDKDLLDRVSLACIGPVTAEACTRNGLTPALVADTYTLQGLVQKLVEGRTVK